MSDETVTMLHPTHATDPQHNLSINLFPATRPSDDVGHMVEVIAADALAMFVSKAADYGDDSFSTANLLGEAGQFAELYRKLGKLYGPMWQGKELAHEQPREILMDLIGHCLLAINYIDQAEDYQP